MPKYVVTIIGRVIVEAASTSEAELRAIMAAGPQFLPTAQTAQTVQSVTKVE